MARSMEARACLLALALCAATCAAHGAGPGASPTAISQSMLNADAPVRWTFTEVEGQCNKIEDYRMGHVAVKSKNGFRDIKLLSIPDGKGASSAPCGTCKGATPFTLVFQPPVRRVGLVAAVKDSGAANVKFKTSESANPAGSAMLELQANANSPFVGVEHAAGISEMVVEPLGDAFCLDDVIFSWAPLSMPEVDNSTHATAKPSMVFGGAAFKADPEDAFHPPVSSTKCMTGTLSGKYCCDKACGVCGGNGCETRPGGASNCCTVDIGASKRICAAANDVGCVVPEGVGVLSQNASGPPTGNEPVMDRAAKDRAALANQAAAVARSFALSKGEHPKDASKQAFDAARDSIMLNGGTVDESEVVAALAKSGSAGIVNFLPRIAPPPQDPRTFISLQPTTFNPNGTEAEPIVGLDASSNSSKLGLTRLNKELDSIAGSSKEGIMQPGGGRDTGIPTMAPFTTLPQDDWTQAMWSIYNKKNATFHEAVAKAAEEAKAAARGTGSEDKPAGNKCGAAFAKPFKRDFTDHEISNLTNRLSYEYLKLVADAVQRLPLPIFANTGPGESVSAWEEAVKEGRRNVTRMGATNLTAPLLARVYGSPHSAAQDTVGALLVIDRTGTVLAADGVGCPSSSYSLLGVGHRYRYMCGVVGGALEREKVKKDIEKVLKGARFPNMDTVLPGPNDGPSSRQPAFMDDENNWYRPSVAVRLYMSEGQLQATWGVWTRTKDCTVYGKRAVLRSNDNTWGGLFSRQLHCTRVCPPGSIMLGDCSCQCTGPWKGRYCERCTRDEEDCKHGGKLNTTTCSCDCSTTSWTGAACSVCPADALDRESCLANGTWSEKDCRCACKAPWTGAICGKCGLNPETACKNGGMLDVASCSCACPVQWGGVDCGACRVAAGDCSHGSTLNAATCTCNNCKEPGFGGPLCKPCSAEPPTVDYCKNGGVWDAASACGECVCVPPFSGMTCERCTAGCKPMGTSRVNSTCDCVCAAGWSGVTCDVPPPCEKPCLNGGVRKGVHNSFNPNDNCACDCPDINAVGLLPSSMVRYIGQYCQIKTKPRLACANGGLYNPITSECDCPSNGRWLGPLCDVCSWTKTSCLHGGTLDKEECACNTCDTPWSGDSCNRCPFSHQVCASEYGAGATLDRRACRCRGGRCLLIHGCAPRCTLTQADCAKGGKFDFDTCACQCPHPWTGLTCSDCSLRLTSAVPVAPASLRRRRLLGEEGTGGDGTGLQEVTTQEALGGGRVQRPNEAQLMREVMETAHLEAGLDFALTMNGVRVPPRTSKCLHGGELSSTPGQCKCVCPEGWGGQRCETKKLPTMIAMFPLTSSMSELVQDYPALSIGNTSSSVSSSGTALVSFIQEEAAAVRLATTTTASLTGPFAEDFAAGLSDKVEISLSRITVVKVDHCPASSVPPPTPTLLLSANAAWVLASGTYGAQAVAALKDDLAKSLATSPTDTLNASDIILLSKTSLLTPEVRNAAVDGRSAVFGVEIKFGCAPGRGPSDTDVSQAIADGGITLTALTSLIKESSSAPSASPGMKLLSRLNAVLPARYGTRPSQACVTVRITGVEGEKTAAEAALAADGVPLLPVGAKLRRPVSIGNPKVTPPPPGDGCRKTNADCKNGGYLNSTEERSCTCYCRGDWAGERCDRVAPPKLVYLGASCGSPPNLGTVDAVKGGCTCPVTNPKYGLSMSHDNCNRCQLGASQCKNGAKLNKAACACESCPYPWSGPTCEECGYLKGTIPIPLGMRYQKGEDTCFIMSEDGPGFGKTNPAKSCGELSAIVAAAPLRSRAYISTGNYFVEHITRHTPPSIPQECPSSSSPNPGADSSGRGAMGCSGKMVRYGDGQAHGKPQVSTCVSQSGMSSKTAGAVCCDMAGNLKTDTANLVGCGTGLTFCKAAKKCAAKQLRLCSVSELEDAEGTDPGCGFNSKQVWTGTGAGGGGCSTATSFLEVEPPPLFGDGSSKSSAIPSCTALKAGTPSGSFYVKPPAVTKGGEAPHDFKPVTQSPAQKTHCEMDTGDGSTGGGDVGGWTLVAHEGLGQPVSYWGMVGDPSNSAGGGGGRGGGVDAEFPSPFTFRAAGMKFNEILIVRENMSPAPVQGAGTAAPPPVTERAYFKIGSSNTAFEEFRPDRLLTLKAVKGTDLQSKRTYVYDSIDGLAKMPTSCYGVHGGLRECMSAMARPGGTSNGGKGSAAWSDWRSKSEEAKEVTPAPSLKTYLRCSREACGDTLWPAPPAPAPLPTEPTPTTPGLGPAPAPTPGNAPAPAPGPGSGPAPALGPAPAPAPEDPTSCKGMLVTLKAVHETGTVPVFKAGQDIKASLRFCDMDIPGQPVNQCDSSAQAEPVQVGVSGTSSLEKQRFCFSPPDFIPSPYPSWGRLEVTLTAGQRAPWRGSVTKTGSSDVAVEDTNPAKAKDEDAGEGVSIKLQIEDGREGCLWDTYKKKKVPSMIKAKEVVTRNVTLDHCDLADPCQGSGWCSSTTSGASCVPPMPLMPGANISGIQGSLPTCVCPAGQYLHPSLVCKPKPVG